MGSGKIEVVHANCLEWLRQQSSGSVAGVVTDPPFFLQGTDNLGPFLNDVLNQCLRVSKGPVIFIGPIQWEFEKQRARRTHPPYKVRPHNVGLWVMKVQGSRGAAPIHVWNGPSPGSFEIDIPMDAIAGEKTTLKPVGLFSRLVKLLPKGKVVDPFAGYGTCADACRFLRRDCVLIENHPVLAEETRNRFLRN